MAFQPPYKNAAINVAASGNNTLVAGVTGQTIRVYRIMLTLASGTITFQDGASTALSGAMTLTTLMLETTQHDPLFVTSPGNGFVANLSGANQLSGTIWYEQS